MALPTLSTRWSSRSRTLERQIVRQREQEAHWRQQWETNSQYFREQNIRSSKQAQWSSRQSFHQSMTAYHRNVLREEKQRSLEERRERLRILLQEERDKLEAELHEVFPNRAAQAGQLIQKAEEYRSAREERRKKLAQELLREHWKKNDPELRKTESTLHQDHVIRHWEVQQMEKKQQEEAAREEKQRFENEYERTRREALERIKREEERRKAEAKQQAEELQRQMEELKLREEEANRLKKEQEALLSQRWEVEKLEDERRRQEECRKKYELRCFLGRQYRTQLKRRAQQVQEELEMDRQILMTLLEAEQEDQRLARAQRERAVADAAWMKHVIEEQLQLEREREAEFDILYREDAQRVWERREAEWEKERKARERLMQEVLIGRQQQLALKMQENRRAQEESLRRREELIQELERVKQARQLEREHEESQKIARLQEIDAQVEQRRREQLAAHRRRRLEEEEEKETQSRYKDDLRLEVERMTHRGHQEKIHSRPRTAWT